MNRSIAIALGLLLVAAAVFAAGETEAEETGRTVVRYAFWGNPDAIGVEQEIIDAFEAANPDIDIEPIVSSYNDHHARLFTLIAGDTVPDVMRIDSYYMQGFVDAGVVLPLDGFAAEAGIDTDDYYAQGIVENTYGGVLYGLPWGTAPIYMLLNLDVFETYGVEIPAYDWTVDDFVAIVEEFGRHDGVYGFAQEILNIANFYRWIWAEGGDIFSEDGLRFALHEPEATRAVQRMADLYQAGLMPQDSITADTGTHQRWFINGNVAISSGAASDILTYQRAGVRFRANPSPIGVTPRTTVVKSNSISIAANSENPDAAWRFLEFLRAPGRPGEELYMRARRIPPTIRGDQYWNLYADTSRSPLNIREATEAISETYGRGMILRDGVFEIEQLALPAIQRVFIGDISASGAMEEIRPAAQAILDRLR